MVRLVKFIKPYVLLVLFAVILLYIQAQCDLALPDYMSKIINEGVMTGSTQKYITYGRKDVSCNTCWYSRLG